MEHRAPTGPAWYAGGVRTYPRIRKCLRWAWRMLVVFGPILLPGALMWAFILAALMYVGPVALIAIAFACVPYLVLCVQGVVMWRARRPVVAWLLAVLPAVALACVHAALIADHLAAVRNPPLSPSGGEFSIRPEAVTAIAFAVVALIALGIIAVWSAVVGCWVWARRRRVRIGHCHACGYDRTGLAASAVCPECGSRPSRLGGGEKSPA